MRKTKFLILFICISFFAMPKLFSENEMKKWNIGISNAYLDNRFDNIQLEINRRIGYIDFGFYVQALNYVLEIPNKSFESDYLPLGGFMSNGRGVQTGLQISLHRFKPESKYDFWLKGQVGLNHSNLYNNPGNYWYYEGGEKQFYTLSEKKARSFNNLEASVGIGLSRELFQGFSVFIEPMLNFQFKGQNYRTGQEQLKVEGFFLGRWGISFAF